MPMYDEASMVGADRRQSQIMETCLKLRAQIRELAEKAGPLLLPEVPRETATLNERGSRDNVSPALQQLQELIALTRSISEDVETLTNRLQA